MMIKMMDDQTQVLGWIGEGLKSPLHSRQVFIVGWNTRHVGVFDESPACFCCLHVLADMH